MLIHGWATDSSIWREQLAALARHYTVVTLDLGGAGCLGSQSTDLVAARTSHRMSRRWLHKLPNAHIILVGDGLGGPVALEAAPLIGARVRRHHRGGDLSHHRPAGAAALQVDQYLQPFRADFRGGHPAVCHRHAVPCADRSGRGARVADLHGAQRAGAGVATLTELNKLDYASILPAVKVPIVVIDSDLGGAVDEARLRKVVPQLRLITLGGDDSFPMLDDSQRFNTTLLQAIDSLAAQ